MLANIILPNLLQHIEQSDDKYHKIMIHTSFLDAFHKQNIPILGNARDEVIRELINRAKPEIMKLLKYYRKIKELNDKISKKILMPLLKKYISNPISK